VQVEAFMIPPDERKELNKVTQEIIGCAYKVGNTLGSGFLEKVYENALSYEMSKAGLNVERQVKLNVYYESIIAGEYIADIIVEQKVLVELKSVKALNDDHMAQCMNYLKATGLPVCLLINFGRNKVDVKRIAN
jgi:GxxExxY protein